MATRPSVAGTPTTAVYTTAVNAFTIGKPTGVVDGDFLVVAVSGQSSTITGDFTSPGWSRLSYPFSTPNGNDAGRRVTAFYGLPVPDADALAATSSFTFNSTDGTGGRLAVACRRLIDVDLDDPVDVYSGISASASATTTVPGVTSTEALGLLLTAFNAQTTGTNDYSVATPPSGMTSDVDLVTQTGSGSKTRLVVYRQDVTTGALGDRALVWTVAPAQHSGNSIVLRARPDAPSVPTVSYTVDAAGTLATGSVYYTVDAAGTLAAAHEVRPMPHGYTDVAAMLATEDFAVAHRGGSLSWPECSLHAYTQAAFWGVGALEIPVGRSSDGVLFGLHDPTLDRTSGTTGFTASAHTWAEIQAHQISQSLPGGQTAKPYMPLDELFDAYAASHVIFVDPKGLTFSQRTALLDAMDAAGGPDRFVWKFYGVSTVYAPMATARGYQTWGYFYDSDAADWAAHHAQWSILGLNYDASGGDWSTFLTLAAGRPVMGHICPDAAAVSSAAGKGADGFMVSGVRAALPRSA